MLVTGGTPLPDVALKIVMQSADKEDKAAAEPAFRLSTRQYAGGDEGTWLVALVSASA
jgi:hypothetical protein